MKDQINQLLDKISEFLAFRKGLLPLIGMVLIVLNLFISVLAPASWLSATGLFLHLGIIVAILGFLLGWAL
ncbi:MAG: hypothetical protein DRI56_08555 [Chloroflexota bacterium]|nr:MAG: hypothetical protein B6243_04235 [Anaerolineaceae bacterium 4572_5.2]RLD06103.1 MAG: hypothetical protein DRI56_08555 [Chloroflexota bacterium]